MLTEENKKCDSGKLSVLPSAFFSDEIPVGSWNYFFFPSWKRKICHFPNQTKSRLFESLFWKFCLWLEKIRICYECGLDKHYFHRWMKDRKRFLRVWRISSLLGEARWPRLPLGLCPAPSLLRSFSSLCSFLLLVSHTLHDCWENAINNGYKAQCSPRGDKLGMTKYQLPAAQLKALSVQLVITFNLIRTPGIVSIS